MEMYIMRMHSLVVLAARAVRKTQTPYFKYCDCHGCCNRAVKLTRDNKTFVCNEKRYVCSLCEHMVHSTRLFLVCETCRCCLCVDCSDKLRLGTGALRCDNRYLYQKQKVCKIIDQEARGVMLDICENEAATVYKFYCTITIYGCDQYELYINIAHYKNDPHNRNFGFTPITTEYELSDSDISEVIDRFTLPYRHAKKTCIECERFETCRGDYCVACGDDAVDDEAITCMYRYASRKKIVSYAAKDLEPYYC